MSWPKKVRISIDKTKLINKEEWWKFYDYYLKTDHWKEKRRRILEIVGNKCIFNHHSCKGWVEIHHNEEGYRNLWDESEIPGVHLVPMCQGHHESFHILFRRDGVDERIKKFRATLSYL